MTLVEIFSLRLLIYSVSTGFTVGTAGSSSAGGASVAETESTREVEGTGSSARIAGACTPSTAIAESMVIFE